MISQIAAKPPPWIWAFAACIVFFMLILALSPVLRIGIFTANVAAASFLAMVGIGQMFPDRERGRWHRPVHSLRDELLLFPRGEAGGRADALDRNGDRPRHPFRDGSRHRQRPHCTRASACPRSSPPLP